MMRAVRCVPTGQGFNEKQTVALMGAHSIGKMEKVNSGYTGVWETSATPSVMDVTPLLSHAHARTRRTVVQGVVLPRNLDCALE